MPCTHALAVISERRIGIKGGGRPAGATTDCDLQHALYLSVSSGLVDEGEPEFAIDYSGLAVSFVLPGKLHKVCAPASPPMNVVGNVPPHFSISLNLLSETLDKIQ